MSLTLLDAVILLFYFIFIFFLDITSKCACILLISQMTYNLSLLLPKASQNTHCLYMSCFHLMLKYEMSISILVFIKRRRRRHEYLFIFYFVFFKISRQNLSCFANIFISLCDIFFSCCCYFYFLLLLLLLLFKRNTL